MMIITGDNAFFETFEALQAAGHTMMIAFRENANKMSTVQRLMKL